MSLREDIMQSAARAQRGIRIAANDRFVRGLQVVYVIEVGEAIRWREEATGQEQSGDRRAFTGRALERLRVPATSAGGILDTAWSLATMKRTAADRVFLLRSTFQQADIDIETRAQIDAWIGALRRGEEPTR